jgi:hypothetical protein
MAAYKGLYVIHVLCAWKPDTEPIQVTKKEMLRVTVEGRPGEGEFLP